MVCTFSDGQDGKETKERESQHWYHKLWGRGTYKHCQIKILFIEILKEIWKWTVNEIYEGFVCLFQQINTDKLTTFINTINGKDGNRYI